MQMMHGMVIHALFAVEYQEEHTEAIEGGYKHT